MRKQRSYEERYFAYPTPVDSFRRRETIDLNDWALRAGVSRTQLNRYRAGGEMTTTTLNRLVRAASEQLMRPVRAAEIVGDLGEETPLAARPDAPAAYGAGHGAIRYDTKLDRLLRKHGWPIDAFARRVPLSRQEFRHLRRGRAMTVSMLKRLVVTFRKAGIDVRAMDIADVGENA